LSAVTHRASTNGRLFWLGLVLSVAAHLTLGRYLLLHRSEAPGAVEMPSEAISINLETTDILNAPEQSAATSAAAGNPTPPTEQTQQEMTPEPPKPDEAAEKRKAEEAEREKQDAEARAKQEAEARERQQAEERARHEAEALAKRDAEEQAKREADERERLARERAGEQKRREEAEEREAERERQAEQRERAEERRKARQKAARSPSGASGSRGANASKGRISASQGAVRNYAAIVRSRIARASGGSAKGTAAVAFGISPSGQLLFARITRSSGNRGVDQSALAAVRQAAPFPPPPAGLTAAQRVFTTTVRIH
jgi:TolA protein